MVKPVINRMLNLMRKLARLFIIKNRFEASAIIYALALGGAERGKHYLDIYPGFAGKMLFLAAMVAVFMAGASASFQNGMTRATVSCRHSVSGI